jgi:hypothetical protein
MRYTGYQRVASTEKCYNRSNRAVYFLLAAFGLASVGGTFIKGKATYILGVIAIIFLAVLAGPIGNGCSSCGASATFPNRSLILDRVFLPDSRSRLAPVWV